MKELFAPVLIAVGDGHAPVLAESPRGYLHAGRRLPSLILAAIDHAGDPLYKRLRESGSGDLLDRPVLLDIGLQYPVEPIVSRQRVLACLVRAELRSRGLGKYPFRDCLLA